VDAGGSEIHTSEVCSSNCVRRMLVGMYFGKLVPDWGCRARQSSVLEKKQATSDLSPEKGRLTTS